MRKTMPSILSIILLFVVTAGAQNAFTLNQGVPVTIILADSHSPAEQTAAEELKTYLTQMIGAPCVLASESQTNGSVIYVGPTAFAQTNGIDCAMLGKEEWILRTVGDRLIVAGGRPRGTLYAAYEMLERLGVVWSDVNTEFVPEIESESLDWDLQNKPAIMNRSIYSGISNSSKTLRFFARNRLNAQISISEALGGAELHGSPGNGHTFHAYTSPEWPDDWFAMNKEGQRVRSTSARGPSQLCLTSPGVRAAVCSQLRSFIQSDRAKASSPDLYPRLYDISQNDGGGECYCPTCSAVLEREGSYSGVLLDFINEIARDITNDYPDILIQTFAYTFTLDTPLHIKPESNVIMRVCKAGCEFSPAGKADTQFPNTHPRNQDYHDNFLRWANISPNLAVWDYWIIYTKAYDAPYLNARHIQEDMAFYRDHNVKTFFSECESPTTTSFFPFKVWFGLKMMVDPEQSYDELALRFCRAQYGPAAQPMLTFLNFLQDRESAADTALGTINPNEIPYLDHAFFTTANALLDEAEGLAVGHPDALLNIARERVPVDAALLNLSRLFRGNLPAGGTPPFDLEALVDRYMTNSLIQATLFYSSDVYPRKPSQFDAVLVRLEIEKNRFLGTPQNLPPEFEDQDVVDINWTTFIYATIIDDPDSLTGKAALLPDAGGNEDYHKLPFNMGLYSRLTKQSLTQKAISAEEIPQDGKFHLYPLGKHTIGAQTIFWAHRSWLISIPIDTAYLPGQDNDWEVYASIKLVGAPYQENSAEPTRVLVDRVLLVMPPPPAGTTFDFVVKTSTANETFKFQIDNPSGFIIDRGDGTTNTAVLTGSQVHVYAAAGLYTNRVSGTATRIAFGGAGTTPQLLRDIVSPLIDGVIGIKSAYEMFKDATNITQFARANWFDAASTNVTDMFSMFHGASHFNQAIGNWDVSKVTDMGNLFRMAPAFNKTLGRWNVSKVTKMSYMFMSASSFNQAIGDWDVSNVKTMLGMLFGASTFNQDIGGWDVGKVTNMSTLFYGPSIFNQDIGGWAVSNVTDMSSMFSGASVFDKDIGNWDVSNVINMTSMFNGASVFNQDIGRWKVSKVATMDSMFRSASLFNQDIGRWDVNNVNTMDRMFISASAFNQDIGRWDVSNVTNMIYMLTSASAFKQDISPWNVSKVANFTGFLNSCTLPTPVYNQLLIRWSRLSLKPGLTFSGGNSKYDNGLPWDCREHIRTTFAWTISDGGTTGNMYRTPETVFYIR